MSSLGQFRTVVQILFSIKMAINFNLIVFLKNNNLFQKRNNENLFVIELFVVDFFSVRRDEAWSILFLAAI